MSSESTSKAVENFDTGCEKQLDDLVLQVKQKLEAQNVQIPGHCDLFIVRCIRVKNYDVEKAAKLVGDLTDVRNVGINMKMQAMQDLYLKCKPSELKGLHLNGSIVPLIKRDDFGRQIFLARAKTWDPNEYDFDQTVASFIALVNYSVAQSIETQLAGVVLALDFKNWSWDQIRSFKFGRLRLVLKILQNSSPAKIKGIHAINHPKVISALFPLIKPVLKQKLASRIHFHGDQQSLLKFFYPEFPETLNAITLQNMSSFVDEKLLTGFIQSDEYQQDIIKFGYPSC